MTNNITQLLAQLQEVLYTLEELKKLTSCSTSSPSNGCQKLKVFNDYTGSKFSDEDTLYAEMVKKAEMYKWLRKQNWNESKMCVVLNPKNSVKLGYDCPSEDRLDAFIIEGIKLDEQRQH